MDENEQSLVGKAKIGNIEAFETLILAYQKKVYNIALRMIDNREDAAEITQEVFLKAFKSIEHFKQECLFSTWLYRITTNTCLDELRKRKNNKVISLDEQMRVGENEIERQIEDHTLGPDILLEKKELTGAVCSAILSLPEEHRMVIILRDVQGFRYEEIAHILKCPEGTIKSRINRARKALKDILYEKKELIGY